MDSAWLRIIVSNGRRLEGQAMDFENITPEMMEEARACKSPASWPR